MLTLLPKTEIKKGKAEEDRKITGIEGIKTGDIAGITVIEDFTNNTLIAMEIDIIDPYYCEEFLKPPGCIEE